MMKSEDSWIFHQHSAWDSRILNQMNRLLPPSQQSITLSCMNPFTFSANVAFRRFSVSCFPGLETGQANGANRLSYCLPPLIESSISPSYPYIKEPQYAFPPRRLRVKTMPNDVTNSNHKRFLIYDQSGHRTRFFLSPFGSSSQSPFIATLKPVHACHSRDVEQVPLTERISPTKPTIQGESDENQITGEGNEYHEDAEEINALLYSDDDEYEYDYDDGEGGEVTSTDHSPLSIKVSLENNEQVGGIAEEVATSNGSTKRQRLLDGGYKKSDATSSTKFDRSYEYDDDAESCCSHARSEGKVMGSNLGTNGRRTDKIHETLKILEDIIPGLKSKEPLLIIDEAINYLKSLKIKARALGLSY